MKSSKYDNNCFAEYRNAIRFLASREKFAELHEKFSNSLDPNKIYFNGLQLKAMNSGKISAS